MKFWAAIIICIMYGTVYGQETSSGHYQYAPENIEYVPELNADLSLFLIPLEGGADVFSAMSMYNFSAVRYLRRGYEYRHTKQYVNGIDLSDPISGRMNFSLVGLTRKTRSAEGYKSGLASDAYITGGLCGITQRSVRARDAAAGNRASISVSDRRYRLAMDVSSSGMGRDGRWAYAVAASRKFGRDAHIDGVFADNYGFTIAADRIVNDKHAISFFAAAEQNQQGMRSASTREAFSLIGNNLYNPSWGYYMGKVRNSKVGETMQPFFVVSYDAELSEKTKLTTSISYQFGKSYFSGMSWRNAQTPQPDYYRSMPGFFGDQQLAEVVAKQWRDRNSDVVQINWDELSRQNIMSNLEAVYFTENRVENIGNLQFVASAQSQINSRIDVSYGFRFRNDRKQNYKQLKDLLGAVHLTDTDLFLKNEDFFTDPVQNDLRNPNRRVAQGDMFGYNYDLRLRQWSGFARIGYRENGFTMSCAAELGGTTYWRTGNYDKQAARDIKSFGESAKQSFDCYKIKFGIGYSFSPRQNVDATIMYEQQAQMPDNRFVSPLYSNITTDAGKPIKIAAAETNYNLTLNPIKLKLSLFYTQIRDEDETYNYYDDVASTSSHLILSEMNKCHYGVEFGADVPLAKGLNLRLSASLASYTYGSDARADILSEEDLSALVTNERAYIKNYNTGSAPQQVASAELKYSGSYGWLATLSINHMAQNYININPIRRMARTLKAASSPELFAQLTTQEQLPAATTLNLFVLKSFTLGRSDFYVILSVNNLLNNENMIFSGYEQMRLRKTGRGLDTSYAPFDSKYLYSYGRTYFCSINYKF